MKNASSKKGRTLPANSVTLVTGAIDGPRDKRFYEPDKLMVKFADAYTVRLRNKKLKRLGAKDGLSPRLDALIGDTRKSAVLPMHGVDEKKIDAWVATARKNLKGPVADLNNYYIVLLDKHDAFEVSAQLMKLEEVQFACPLLKPPPPPAADFTNTTSATPFQGYLRPAPMGIDADFAWTVPGGDGKGVSICDLEYNWNFSHVEFTNNGGLTLLGNAPSDPNNDFSHGTAVVGVFGSNNDFNTTTSPGGTVTSTVDGTTGIAFNSSKFACAVFTFLIYNLAGAISKAMEGLSSGDILLIEQHEPGPNSDYSSPSRLFSGSQQGYVPSEWTQSTYDAIRTAVGNGFVVVEAAGNGGENLDSGIYNPQPNFIQKLLGIEPHRPFIAGNESGAIIVGAGDSTARTRLGFSNFGRRVDVHAWGNNVVTTESPGSTTNPNLANAGPNDQYTSSFSGTSSASPIIAGACAVIQGVHQNLFGRKADPARIRELLLTTNSVQAGDTSQHIGPLPDLRMAIQAMIGSLPPAPWLRPDGIFPLPFEMAMAAYASGFTDLKIWFTLDGTDPVENSATLYQGRVGLTAPGLVEVRARTFATNEQGLRMASPTTTRRIFQLYRRPKAPGNFRASQGTLSDRIRMEWDSIDRALDPRMATISTSTYDVFAVYGGTANPQYHQLNDQPISSTSFEWFNSGLPPLVHGGFVVRGTKRGLFVLPGSPPEMLTEISNTAEGWLAPAMPVLTASKGEFADHVLVHWETYDFGNVYDLVREYFLYRSVSPDAATAVQIAHLQKTYRHVFIGSVERDIPVPAGTSFEDRTTMHGQTYYYWVKARGRNPDGDVVEVPFSNMDSGFMRFA